MNAEISDFHQQIAKSSQRSAFVDPEKLASFIETPSAAPDCSALTLDPMFAPDINGEVSNAASRSTSTGIVDELSPVSASVSNDDKASQFNKFRLKDVPERERPRERMHELGPAGITNTELLAIILGSGIQGINVKNVADNLLTQFDGLRGLSSASSFNMQNVGGIGDVKADVLTAAFELGRRAAQEEIEAPGNAYGGHLPNGEAIAWAVARQFTTRLRDNAQEEMWIVLLDVRNRYRGKARVYIGCCDQLVAKTGEILSRVVERNLPRYALVHNHPSGKGDPSGADISFTERLVRAGQFLDVELVDHVVLGEDLRSFVSMRQRKLVDFSCSPISGRRIMDDDDLSARDR
ncbi:MAG: DNA repair protein RadC [Chloroflexi bacterium]|nr:DNA repair protein RadC [Chloroflexota bacterium]